MRVFDARSIRPLEGGIPGGLPGGVESPPRLGGLRSDETVPGGFGRVGLAHRRRGAGELRAARANLGLGPEPEVLGEVPVRPGGEERHDAATLRELTPLRGRGAALQGETTAEVERPFTRQIDGPVQRVGEAARTRVRSRRLDRVAGGLLSYAAGVRRSRRREQDEEGPQAHPATLERRRSRTKFLAGAPRRTSHTPGGAGSLQAPEPGA